VLSRMPNTDVRFVGKEVGPVVAEGGGLLLSVSHTVAESPSPDLVLVPGGTTTPGQMVDDDVLDWLRKVHEATTWTASVCTGASILGAAGILKGLPATTHWYKMGVLKIMGARPKPDERIVRSGKVVTRPAYRQVSTWRFGWQAKLPAVRGPKRFSWSSNTTHTHRSIAGT
jgi:putative intracellular protease/amidase